EFAPDWYALASGYVGRTRLTRTIGRLQGLDVVTSSFDVGFVRRNAWAEDDAVLLRVGQPMRVEGGTLDVSLRHRRGVLLQRFDVRPSGRTLELGFGYDAMLSERVRMRTMVDYILNPQHSVRRPDELFAIMSIRGAF
ncbi:MAG: hypothetical protein GDA54_06880, partial [Alphaproteobacteria bacterium GM7ARS4]|nr:hypothetical protein [Alphaproteobacteria bacterium GM7ARS4]